MLERMSWCNCEFSLFFSRKCGLRVQSDFLMGVQSRSLLIVDVIVLGKSIYFRPSVVCRSKEKYFVKMWICCLIYLPLSSLILDCCLYLISFLSQLSLFPSHFAFSSLVFGLSHSFKTSSSSSGASPFLKDLK